jgi:UDP-2,3-diacylglucosamine pyrophosphatase LpxH
MEPETTTTWRTLFISDVHLGTKGCEAARLLDFLRDTEADTVYLVGDIVDAWQLKKAWYWPQAHNDVVQKILRKVRKGTRVVYVPGNHDEFLRDYPGTHFGGIEVVERTLHEAADGKRYLIMHGDEFDAVVMHAKWLAHVGDWAYSAAIVVNRWLNVARRRLGYNYWSYSAWAKQKVKRAVNFIGDFEATLAAEARRAGADGVICGHIHHAAIHDTHGVTYMNCGDWVESLTALAEDENGRFHILRWTRVIPATVPVEAADVAVTPSLLRRPAA